MTTQNIIKSILAGENDEDVEKIKRALDARQSILDRDKLYTFKRGDRVRFNHNASPRYLIGVEGKITKINQTRVVVKIGPDGGRFANQSPTCPVDIIDKIAA